MDEKGDYQACIAEGQQTARDALTPALKTVKKSKARDALKAYHATFVTALQGIHPGFDERVYAYDIRQQALRDK